MDEFVGFTRTQAERIAKAVAAFERTDLRNPHGWPRGAGGGGTSLRLCKVISATDNDHEYTVREVDAGTLEERTGDDYTYDARNLCEIGTASCHGILTDDGVSDPPARYVGIWSQSGADGETYWFFESYPGPMIQRYEYNVRSIHSDTGCACEADWLQLVGPAICAQATPPYCSET